MPSGQPLGLPLQTLAKLNHYHLLVCHAYLAMVASILAESYGLTCTLSQRCFLYLVGASYASTRTVTEALALRWLQRRLLLGAVFFHMLPETERFSRKTSAGPFCPAF